MRGGGALSALPPYEGRCPSALPIVGVVPTTPMWRALRPSTPGDFPVAGKVTKGAPRAAAPGPREGDRVKSETLFAPAPPAASRNPLDGVCGTEKDRFATLSRWANRSYFLPKLHRGYTFSCQSVARQTVCGLRATRRGTPFWRERRLPPLGG